jgi:hypothetical protein
MVGTQESPTPQLLGRRVNWGAGGGGRPRRERGAELPAAPPGLPRPLREIKARPRAPAGTKSCRSFNLPRFEPSASAPGALRDLPKTLPPPQNDALPRPLRPVGGRDADGSERRGWPRRAGAASTCAGRARARAPRSHAPVQPPTARLPDQHSAPSSPPFPLPALTLASFAPNVTAYAATLEGAKASLQAAARAALLQDFKMRPLNCLDGKPRVTCLWDVCKGKCPGQLCVPHNCGACQPK